jgi:hypothetical protein
MKVTKLSNAALSRALNVHDSTIRNWRKKPTFNECVTPEHLLDWLERNATARVTIASNAAKKLANEMQIVELCGTYNPIEEFSDVMDEFYSRVDSLRLHDHARKINDENMRQIWCDWLSELYAVMNRGCLLLDICIGRDRDEVEEDFREEEGEDFADIISRRFPPEQLAAIILIMNDQNIRAAGGDTLALSK